MRSGSSLCRESRTAGCPDLLVIGRDVRKGRGAVAEGAAMETFLPRVFPPVDTLALDAPVLGLAVADLFLRWREGTADPEGHPNEDPENREPDRKQSPTLLVHFCSFGWDPINILDVMSNAKRARFSKNYFF